MSAVVIDRVDVYVLGGGSGFLASFHAWCDECPWAGPSISGSGGGSPTPWNTDAAARGMAQEDADRHNAERHSEVTR